MKTVEIIFSPTGGTEKVASIISHSWSSHPTVIDLTDPRKDFSLTSINKEDMVLIAMPSFGGRAPAVAIERLKKIKGNGAKCTLVAVYENRAYEGLFAKERGFSPAKQLLFPLAGMKYDSKAKKEGKAYRFMFVREDGALLEKITDIVEKRNIRPSIYPHKFTLSDINEALTLVDKGHTKGKVIIYFD